MLKTSHLCTIRKLKLIEQTQIMNIVQPLHLTVLWLIYTVDNLISSLYCYTKYFASWIYNVFEVLSKIVSMLKKCTVKSKQKGKKS